MTSPAGPIRFRLTPTAHQARTQAAASDWRGGALARAAAKQAALLEQAERTIADLRPGESGYSTPWGLHRAKGRWWLHPNYPAATKPGGTIQMQVKRTGDRYTAWTVNHDDFPDGARVKVAGLAPFGGPPTKKDRAVTELEQLAVTFDELGEPEMAATQRESARQLRDLTPWTTNEPPDQP